MQFLLLLIFAQFLSVKALSDTDILSKFHQKDFKIKFERIQLVNYSKNIYKDMKIVTFKHNRTAAATNISFVPKIHIDTKKLQILVQAYKFLSNEYRIFPIHFQVNACKALKMDMVGIVQFTKCGNIPMGCYFQKDVFYYVCNFVPDENKLPPFLPSGDFKMEVILIYEDIEILTAHGYVNIYRPIH